MLLQHYTGIWGVRSETANDGPQALERLRAAFDRGDPFDLAILDMQMTGMDGLGFGAGHKGGFQFVLHSIGPADFFRNPE